MLTGVGDIWRARGARAYNKGLQGAEPPAGSRQEQSPWWPVVGGQWGEAPWSWKVLAKQRQNLYINFPHLLHICKGWWATWPITNKCDPFVRGSGSAKSYSVGGVWYANEVEMCKKFLPDQRSVVPKNVIELILNSTRASQMWEGVINACNNKLDPYCNCIVWTCSWHCYWLTMCFLHHYCRTCGLLESFSAKKQCVKNFRLHVKKWWWHVTTVTYKVAPLRVVICCVVFVATRRRTTTHPVWTTL